VSLEILRIRSAIILLVFLSAILCAAPLPYAISPVNAFALGIGGGAVAIPDDPSVIYWNPAGFGLTDLMSVNFTVAAPRFETPGSWAFLVANSSKSEGIRVGLAMIRRYALRDSVKFRSFQFILPITHRFYRESIAFGFSMKFISERFEESSWYYGSAFDLGVMVILPLGLKLGFSTQNIIGSDLRSFGSKPWIGCSWGGRGSPVMLSAQIRADRLRNKSFNSDNFNVGFRLASFGKLPELRGGLMRSKGEEWITAGFAYLTDNSKNAKLEYSLAVDPDSWGEKTHLLTLSWDVYGNELTW